MDRNNPALGTFFGVRREPPLEPPDEPLCPYCENNEPCVEHDEPQPWCNWCGEPLGEDSVTLADGDVMHAGCVFESEESFPLAGWRDDVRDDLDEDAA